ncbi:MAG: acetyl-CoA carboxylase carboxyl transferase subunit beta [Duodenibacillus sp.]|nr:acetyl-CoA carboxylase carboxyl transferase subunit beta [Duodenibacillus sp.]
MSWLTRLLPKISQDDAHGRRRRSPVPAGLWIKCPSCEEVIYKEELEASMMVCPKCGHHERLGARARVNAFLDWKGPHDEIGAEVRPVDALGFVDSKPYAERLAQSAAKTGETDALVVMEGTLRKRPVVAAAFEFGFQGGSMGSVVGERFARGVERCLAKAIPFVTFTTTGGARMQEGLLSLMQMAKTNAAISRLEKAGIPGLELEVNYILDGIGQISTRVQAFVENLAKRA